MSVSVYIKKRESPPPRNAGTLKTIVCQTAPLAKLPPRALFTHEIWRFQAKCSFFKEWSWSALVLVLVYTQEGSLWSIVLRCDDHTGIFTCHGCARDPYFYVPAETQSYVIKLSCSRKVLAASGDWTRNLWVTTISSQPRYPLHQQDTCWAIFLGYETAGLTVHPPPPNDRGCVHCFRMVSV